MKNKNELANPCSPVKMRLKYRHGNEYELLVQASDVLLRHTLV